MEDIHRADTVGGVRVVNDRERSRYELFVRSDLIGFVSYEMSAGYLVLVHAEVRSDKRGRGLGTELTTWVLEDLKRRGLPTRTSCSFVARFVGPEPIALGFGPRSEPSRLMDTTASDDGRNHAA
jgi:predicted GNAT family acetyltransferase